MGWLSTCSRVVLGAAVTTLTWGCWLDWSPYAAQDAATADTATVGALDAAAARVLDAATAGTLDDAAAGTLDAATAGALDGAPPGVVDSAADVDAALPPRDAGQGHPSPDSASPTPRPEGSACSVDIQCSSGSCVQGVCCDRPCTAPCESCLLPGEVGRCSALPAGATPAPPDGCSSEPASSCGLDGRCDGAGGCRRWPPGTRCQEPSCVAGGQTGVLWLGAFCDGDGSCEDAGERDCAPYTCEVSAARCYETCTDLNNPKECLSGFACDEGQCEEDDDKDSDPGPDGDDEDKDDHH